MLFTINLIYTYFNCIYYQSEFQPFQNVVRKYNDKIFYFISFTKVYFLKIKCFNKYELKIMANNFFIQLLFNCNFSFLRRRCTFFGFCFAFFVLWNRQVKVLLSLLFFLLFILSYLSFVLVLVVKQLSLWLFLVLPISLHFSIKY